MIVGIGNELRFRGNPGELRIRTEQLKVLNLRAGQGAVGVGDDSGEGIVHKAIEAGHGERLARVVRVSNGDGQTLYPGAKEATFGGAAERQVGSFLADILYADQDIAG